MGNLPGWCTGCSESGEGKLVWHGVVLCFPSVQVTLVCLCVCVFTVPTILTSLLALAACGYVCVGVVQLVLRASSPVSDAARMIMYWLMTREGRRNWNIRAKGSSVVTSSMHKRTSWLSAEIHQLNFAAPVTWFRNCRFGSCRCFLQMCNLWQKLDQSNSWFATGVYINWVKLGWKNDFKRNF